MILATLAGGMVAFVVIQLRGAYPTAGVSIVARRATAALGLRTIVVLGNLLIDVGFCLLAALGDNGVWACR